MENDKETQLTALGYYSAERLASIRGMSVGSLVNERGRGGGPPFTKMHGKSIIYPIDGFKRWLESRMSTPHVADTLSRPAARRPSRHAA